MRQPGKLRIVPAESEDSILLGWKEVARYMRRSVRHLRRMQKDHGLPVYRFGRNVATDRHLIRTWLMEHGRRVRARKG